jgi:uroporphyrin-III C-methyltransferase
MIRFREPGVVYLVGAGPGDPELITLRGLRLLRAADVVVYDRLVAESLLDEAPAGAERIFAGKASGCHAMSQEEINAILVARAREGKTVVRLKGGDPFVFGRGGEEAEVCAVAGLRWELVPGVSSAIGVPGLAGIPVTHRGTAASFAVVTGHRAAGEGREPDWEALGAIDTLVVLMGVEGLPRIAGRLIAAGRAFDTPVAVIQEGSLPGERVVTGTLGTIAERARAAGVEPPATIVIGEVVRLRDAAAPGSRAVPRVAERGLAAVAAPG